MDSSDHNDFLDSLFPIGEERWVKVKYLDRTKCIRAFNVGPNRDRIKEISDETGFECTAIGIRPEHTPQISALMDLKEDIISKLSYVLEEYDLMELNRMFKEKIEELKERTIRENERA